MYFVAKQDTTGMGSRDLQQLLVAVAMGHKTAKERRDYFYIENAARRRLLQILLARLLFATASRHCGANDGTKASARRAPSIMDAPSTLSIDLWRVGYILGPHLRARWVHGAMPANIKNIQRAEASQRGCRC